MARSRLTAMARSRTCRRAATTARFVHLRCLGRLVVRAGGNCLPHRARSGSDDGHQAHGQEDVPHDVHRFRRGESKNVAQPDAGFQLGGGSEVVAGCGDRAGPALSQGCLEKLQRQEAHEPSGGLQDRRQTEHRAIPRTQPGVGGGGTSGRSRWSATVRVP